MRKLIIGLLLVCSFGVYAEQKETTVDLNGHYKDTITDLKLMYLGKKNNQRIVAVSTILAAERCGGGVAGLGVFKDNKIVFTSYEKAHATDKCSIEIKFSNNGEKATIEETDCWLYHGVACGWEGQTVSKIK